MSLTAVPADAPANGGHVVVLSALVAARFLPLLLLARRAGSIVARHRAVRVDAAR